MELRALEMLALIGDQLDQHVFPNVADGGLVVLNRSAVPLTPSTETHHGRQKERGPAAGSRSGTTGRQGPAGGPRPSGAPAPIVGAGPRAQYAVELRALDQQYPGAQLWHKDDGIWLLTPSQVLPGIRQHAIFVTGISFPGASVRSWAFWANGPAFPEWIGPRHTNFPDGSICAFEPSDGTWMYGDPIVQLLDIYTVWTLRHLYLRQFGRWPGRQSVHFAGERLLEMREDEHCGCGDHGKVYADCCMSADTVGPRIPLLLQFLWATGGARKPPEAVERFVRSQRELPNLAELVEPFSMQPIRFVNGFPKAPYPKRRH